jgi:5-methylcytosine-specific restriction enzyme subunit McrC
MVNIVTFFEHETRKFSWSDQDLTRLERINRAAGTELLRATVYHGERALTAAEYVGVIRLGKLSVQVLPKIYRQTSSSSQTDLAKQATRNLLYLLAGAGQLEVHEQEITNLLRRDMDWFEVLTRLYASHLLKEWQQGAYRAYHPAEVRIPVLKGKWRLADQLRHMEPRHQFEVTYDEFSADHTLNRVFRFVVERLWKLTRDAENQRMLSILRQWMDEVTLLPVISLNDLDRIVIHRLNQRFEPLLNLARLFLNGSSLQLSSGDDQSFSFCFDMNALYEGFLVNSIIRHRAQVLPPALGLCELLPQTSGATRFLAHTEAHSGVLRLKPDLAFRSGSEFPLLLDAKYKRLDGQQAYLGVSREDLYQMYAYAQRYNCPLVLLVYPLTAGSPETYRSVFHLDGSERSIRVQTLDLRVDLGTTAGKTHITNQLKTILEDIHDPARLA